MGGISMADLSDTDKKIMFGENYKELELQAQIASGITDRMKSAQESAAKMDGMAKAAMFFGVVSILIMLANYFATSFPYNQNLQLLAAGTLVLSVVVNLFASNKAKAILSAGA
jgi:hypothetical protein